MEYPKNCRIISMKDAGRDEIWLYKWIMEKPERLGIGPFEVMEELCCCDSNCRRIDILGYNRPTNTYYEIGVTLGDCNAEQGFRTLEHWANERAKNPDANHYAVLVAENLQGRYKRVIEILSQFLPFIGIELKNYKMQSQSGGYVTICRPEILTQPEELVRIGGIETFTEGKSIHLHDEEWWRQTKGDKFVEAVKEMYEYCGRNDHQ